MAELEGFDLEGLADALADQALDGSHHWLVDPATRELLLWTPELGVDGENPVDVDELDHLVLVQPLPSSVWYRDMADFADGISDESAARRLRRALQGRGAFRRFRDELFDEYEHLVPVWQELRNARAERRAVEWLVDRGLVGDEAARAFLAGRPEPKLP